VALPPSKSDPHVTPAELNELLAPGGMGLGVAETDGSLVWLSEGAATALQAQSSDALRGQPLQEVFVAADRERLLWEVFSPAASQAPWSAVLETLQGPHVRVRAWPLPGVVDGREERVGLAIGSVAEQRPRPKGEARDAPPPRTTAEVALAAAQRAEEALRAAHEQGEAATRAKTLFLANMSHELRTPLNAVLGMADLTLKTPLTAAQRENLTILRDAAYSLLDLVSDVLDFARVEAGQLRLHAARFGLQDLLERVLDSVALRAADKGIELVGDIEPGVPRMVVGDAGRLRQILLNVLSNAIKFTDHGEVVLRVRVAG